MNPATATDTPGEAGVAVRHFVLGTAGHIDHGKTALVRALTGMDTDRLPEEKRRGMTIELGFAELCIDHTRFGIVDVPGHERFVRTMVAGAAGIDLALLVVAADDSVMPQTVEHVEILNLLGIDQAVVAVNKIDKIDAEMVELVEEEVRALLDGTPLSKAPVCPVSAVTGAGLKELKEALLAVSRNLVVSASGPPFRMAVDRVFTVQGRGTVVTGSVVRGCVVEGDLLEVLPGGAPCRVRGLQSHGIHVERLERGRRAAINLSGLERERFARGCQLATPGYLHDSHMIDVQLMCLRSCPRPLKSTSIVRLEFGTTEVPARVVLFEGAELAPGESGYAQLRSGFPLTTTYGQRFIIRDENATRTLGGGIVLRPVASRRRGDIAHERQRLHRLEHGRPTDRVEEVLTQAGFATLTDPQICARAGAELDDVSALRKALIAAGRLLPIGDTGQYVTPDAVDHLAERLARWLQRYHQAHPELPGRPADAVSGYLDRMVGRWAGRALYERFLQEGRFTRLGRFICLPKFSPSLSPADEKTLAAMVEEIRAGGFQPPALDALRCAANVEKRRIERLATLAVALGELVPIDAKMYLHTDIEQQLRSAVAKLVSKRGPVTVADVREAIGSTRKFVVPFLEHLDRAGFTKRVGDQRVLAETNDHE